MIRRIVDTNVVLRFLVPGHEHYEKAKAIFELAEQGHFIIVIPEVVIVEIAHVLRSIYKQTNEDRRRLETTYLYGRRGYAYSKTRSTRCT